MRLRRSKFYRLIKSFRPGLDALKTIDAFNRLQQSLRLGRLKAAWESAVQLKSPDVWKSIGMAALERLDMDMALAAFRLEQVL